MTGQLFCVFTGDKFVTAFLLREQAVARAKTLAESFKKPYEVWTFTVGEFVGTEGALDSLPPLRLDGDPLKGREGEAVVRAGVPKPGGHRPRKKRK